MLSVTSSSLLTSVSAITAKGGKGKNVNKSVAGTRPRGRAFAAARAVGGTVGADGRKFFPFSTAAPSPTHGPRRRWCARVCVCLLHHNTPLPGRLCSRIIFNGVARFLPVAVVTAHLRTQTRAIGTHARARDGQNAHARTQTIAHARPPIVVAIFLARTPIGRACDIFFFSSLPYRQW